MAFYDPFFNTLFGFLMNWDPLYSIMFLSFLISLIIVLIYKAMTNQTEMKDLKEQLAKYQKQMREHKKEPEKMLEIQKKAMDLNMKYMGKSMKPTLITFLPIILIFGWMNGHFAYEPLMPGQEFNLLATFEKEYTGNATIIVPEGLEVIGEKEQTIQENTAKFKLKGEKGEYYATIATPGEKFDKKIIITDERTYAPVIENYKGEHIKTIQLDNQTLRVIWGISWFWAYLIFAIVFSIAIRKAMKVH